MPVVLTKYAAVCERNVTGNKQLFIAATADITAVVVTAGEISTVTGALGFVPIGFEQDSYTYTQTSPETKNQIMYEKKHTFTLGKNSLANNTFLDKLSDNLNCGFLIIRGDNNGKYWLSGYSAAEIFSRPYKTMGTALDTGKEPGEADKNVEVVTLMLKNGYRDMPFDATNTGTIAGGTAAFINFA